MSKTCINHPDVPFVTMCHQCHQAICKSCSLVTPQGIFCSSECSVLSRAAKSRVGEAKPGHGAGFFTKASAVFVLLVVGFMGLHVAASKGVTPLRRIDVIGLVLDLVARQNEGARQ